MSYHLHGVGDWPADTVWNPGPGQAPRNDPRTVKQYAAIYGTWQPSGTVSTVSAQIPPYLLRKVQARLPGWNVSFDGNGWVTGGLIKIKVIPPTDTTAGRVKGVFFDATSDYNGDGSRPGGKGTLINPTAYINDSDIKVPPAATTTPSGGSTTPGTTPPVTPSADGSTTPDATGITSTVSGVPVWAIGVGAVGVVGLLGFLALSGKKKAAAPAAAPAAVAANRRHLRRNATSRSMLTTGKKLMKQLETEYGGSGGWDAGRRGSAETRAKARAFGNDMVTKALTEKSAAMRRKLRNTGHRLVGAGL